MTNKLPCINIVCLMRHILLLLFLGFHLGSHAQYFSGYVGDDISLPEPIAPAGYTTFPGTAVYSTTHMNVSVSGSRVTIMKYFTGHALINCTYRCYREYYVADRYYVDYQTPTTYYYITCNPINLMGIPSNVEMEEGETKTINWSWSPSSKLMPKLYWESSDYSVVYANDGKLTAKAAGTTIVTVENNSGPDEQIWVVVKEGKKLKLTASPSGGELIEGSQVSLKCNRDGAAIYYTLDGNSPSKSSTNYSSPITLNESCTLKAIAYKDGYETSSVLTENYTIKKRIVPTGITVTNDAKTIGVGESVNASYEIIPSDANSSLKVTWSSDDKSIATVDNSGKITGIKEGITFIRATTENGKSDACKIMVTTESHVFDDGIGVATFATSGLHTLIVKNDGTLWACGQNTSGELCDGTKKTSTTPKYIMSNVVAVSAGRQNTTSNSFILKRDGTLWVCGTNSWSPLGVGHGKDVTVLTKMMEDVAQVSSTGYKSFFLKKDGTLWSCGRNWSYELGVGSSSESTEKQTPVKILSDVAKITPGGKIMAIKKDNTLWAWGDNEYGQLGDGTTTARYSPVKVFDDVVTASSDGIVTTAIKSDGTMWSCGGNKYYYLFDGTENSKNFMKVADDISFSYEGSGYIYTVKKDGSLWVYGDNSFGQLGTGTKEEHIYYPVKIMEDVDTLCSRMPVTLVRKKDGSLWVFGSSNSYGQMCDGTTDTRLTPYKIMNAPDGRPYEITMKQAEISIGVGKTISIDYSLKPANATTPLKWSSDDTTIATVNASGDVKGIKPGTTYINVETENGKIDWCKVTVYVEEIERTVKTSSAGYATFYDSNLAYKLPKGLTAQVVSSVGNNKLTYKTIADGNASEFVPAGVPVMLVSNQKSATTYKLQSTWSEDVYSGKNLLCGSDEATTTTGDGSHYKLSYGKTGSNLNTVFGWYWGAQNGGSFQIEGHKAWLVVPKSSGGSTRGFTIDGDTTGIVNVDEGETVYYNLQGRRIEKPMAKGVYIMNGKKITIK